MVLESPEATTDSSVALLAITRRGVELALRLQEHLHESTCYVPSRHEFAISKGAERFEKLEEVVPKAWLKHTGLVFIMASGIVVRKIAPLLEHKTVDPAVVVVDEEGRFAVSLVSGHLGGANKLAGRIAKILGAQAVITTASDVQNEPAIDLVAQEAGLKIENISFVSRISRALLERETIWMYDPEARLETYLKRNRNLVKLAVDPNGQSGRECPEPKGSPFLKNFPGAVGIWVSEYEPPPQAACLLLRPCTLVVGLGCNRGTSAEEILGLLQNVFKRERLSALSIRNFASIDLKADEDGIRQVAQTFGKSVLFYPPKEIERMAVPNPSNMVAKHIGVHSVCEAAALLSAKNGYLLVPKQKTANVTLAVARVSSP